MRVTPSDASLVSAFPSLHARDAFLLRAPTFSLPTRHCPAMRARRATLPPREVLIDAEESLLGRFRPGLARDIDFRV